MATSHRLAAIMFSDITGFTRLMGQDEKRALHVLEYNRALHKKSIASYSGEYLKEMGDGTLSSYSSVSDAVYCAIDIMRGASEDQYRLRIGIHLGDVLFEEGDVFGDGVNIASRLQTLAIPGSILVSEKVYDELRNKPDIKTQFLGKILFKNDVKQRSIYAIASDGLKVPDSIHASASHTALGGATLYDSPVQKELPTSSPVAQSSYLKRGLALALIIMTGILIYYKLIAPVMNEPDFSGDIVLAVFPFAQDTSNNNNTLINPHSFTVGLSEKLSLVRGLTTISADNLSSYKTIMGQARVGSILNDRELLDSIKATHYIKGHIDSKIHLSLYSINKPRPLWKRNFALEDSSAIFDLIGAEVANRLHLEYKLAQQQRDPKVVALYVKALSGWHKRGQKQKLFEAIDFLEEALKIDADDAEVNGLLALCYVVGLEREYFAFDSVETEIINYRNKALNIDPDQPYGLLAKGGYYFALDQYDKTKEYYLKSLQSAPGYGITLQALAELDLFTGDYHGAYKYINMADLAAPNDETIFQFRIWCEMANGYANASKKLAERFLLLYPANKNRNYHQWADYLISKNYDLAIKAIPPDIKSVPVHNRLLTGIVYIDQNNKAQFDELLNGYNKNLDRVLHILWSLQNGSENDKILAREHFSKMLDEGSFGLFNLIQTYPFMCFNTFRTDPVIVKLSHERQIDLSPHPYFRIQSELRK